MGVVRNVGTNTFPKQYLAGDKTFAGIGRKVTVCFGYDTQNSLEGVIIRDDKEYPYRTIIRLADGRVVLASECQFKPLPGIDKRVFDKFTFKQKDF